MSHWGGIEINGGLPRPSIGVAGSAGAASRMYADAMELAQANARIKELEGGIEVDEKLAAKVRRLQGYCTDYVKNINALEEEARLLRFGLNDARMALEASRQENQGLRGIANELQSANDELVVELDELAIDGNLSALHAKIMRQKEQARNLNKANARLRLERARLIEERDQAKQLLASGNSGEKILTVYTKMVKAQNDVRSLTNALMKAASHPNEAFNQGIDEAVAAIKTGPYEFEGVLVDGVDMIDVDQAFGAMKVMLGQAVALIEARYRGQE